MSEKMPMRMMARAATVVRIAPDANAPALMTLASDEPVVAHSVMVGYNGNDVEPWASVGFVRLADLDPTEHDGLVPYRVLRQTWIREGPGMSFPVALGGTAMLRVGDAFRGLSSEGPWVWVGDGRGFAYALDVIERESFAHIDRASELLSPPRASAEQATAFILARGTRYLPIAVSEIVGHYWRVAVPVGIDPLVALAQCLHETDNLRSWWALRPRRNPAGIGVTGETRDDPPPDAAWAFHEEEQIWRKGLSFETWEHSARAHIGRLLAYAITDSAATPEQRALIDYALALRPLPEKYRGVAPTLEGLNGRWAFPGEDYADRMARYANAILEAK